MRREELKKAAIKVFSEHGYHSAKVSQIVAEAGVAQGTFYLYFNSKQEIFGETLSDFLTLVTEAISSWQGGSFESIATVSGLRRELKVVALEIVNVFLENEELTRIFFTEALAVDPAYNAVIEGFYSRVVALISVTNEFGAKTGLYRPVNSTVLAHAVVGMVQRVAYEHIVRNQMTRERAEEALKDLIDIVLFGVAVEGHPSETSDP